MDRLYNKTIKFSQHPEAGLRTSFKKGEVVQYYFDNMFEGLSGGQKPLISVTSLMQVTLLDYNLIIYKIYP